MRASQGSLQLGLESVPPEVGSASVSRTCEPLQIQNLPASSFWFKFAVGLSWGPQPRHKEAPCALTLRHSDYCREGCGTAELVALLGLKPKSLDCQPGPVSPGRSLGPERGAGAATRRNRRGEMSVPVYGQVLGVGVSVV